MPGIDKKLKAKLEEYIQIYYVPEQEVLKESKECGKYLPKEGGASKPQEFDFDELISELGETFHDMLFRIIREQNRDEAEVYKKAHVDRRLFSKIRNNPAYHPKDDR